MIRTYKLPPLNWLLSFEAGARHISFAASARQFGLSIASASYQIKCLANMIKAALFDIKPLDLKRTVKRAPRDCAGAR